MSLTLHHDLTFTRADDGSGILLDLTEGEVHHLNRTAAQAWTTLIAGSTMATAAGRLVDRFGIDHNTAATDVQTFLDELARLGIAEYRL